MWEENFIKEYNHLIGRYKKACAFFENPNTTIEAMEEWQEEFISIAKKLGEKMLEYKKKTGQAMNPIEEKEGFKI